MRRPLKKLIENKAIDASYCEKVLGGMEGLYLLADFWERNAGLFHLIGTNELLEFIDSEEFDSKQVEAFKKGISKIPLFLQKCLEERQAIEAKKLTATPPVTEEVQ